MKAYKYTFHFINNKSIEISGSDRIALTQTTITPWTLFIDNKKKTRTLINMSQVLCIEEIEIDEPNEKEE